MIHDIRRFGKSYHLMWHRSTRFQSQMSLPRRGIQVVDAKPSSLVVNTQKIWTADSTVLFFLAMCNSGRLKLLTTKLTTKAIITRQIASGHPPFRCAAADDRWDFTKAVDKETQTFAVAWTCNILISAIVNPNLLLTISSRFDIAQHGIDQQWYPLMVGDGWQWSIGNSWRLGSTW